MYTVGIRHTFVLQLEALTDNARAPKARLSLLTYIHMYQSYPSRGAGFVSDAAAAAAAGIVIIATCLCATYAVMDVHKLKRVPDAELNAPLIQES